MSIAPDVKSHSATGLYHQWMAVAWISVLFFAVYSSTLLGMAGSWFDDKTDMGHGVFVPLAAAYMVWDRRSALSRIRPAPSAWGLVLVGWSAVQLIFGTVAQWIWISRIAFLVALTGCLVALYGFQMVRELAYPLCTLVLMIAPPTFVYEHLTLPLQLLASRIGEVSLEGLGYSVLREGNILELVGERLAVEEACSGIRSLIALFFLCTVYSYCFVSQRIVRGILLAAVIPIAILCNSGRIVATGVVGQFDRQLAHGILHETFGHFGLALGALLCFLLHRTIVKSNRFGIAA